MAVVGKLIAVGTGPTILLSGANGSINDPIPGVIKSSPTNTLDVFVGGSTVSALGGSSTGYSLEPGQALSFQLINGENVYGVVTSTAVNIDVIVGRQNGSA